MRRLVLVVFILLWTNYSWPLQQEKTKTDIDSIYQKDLPEDSNTFTVYQFDSSNQSENGLTDSMPWIAAIIIGLLTVIANLIISRENRKSNLVINDKEITNAKQIALEQIKNVRDGMEMDFNKTVLSGNRQIWITKFREVMSFILTMHDRNAISDDKFKDLKLLSVQVELLLLNDTHREILPVLKEFQDVYFDILIENKEFVELEGVYVRLKDMSVKVINSEWNKIKAGE